MMGYGMGKKGRKGLLLMATCCGAPLLLLLALPVHGPVLGGLEASEVSTLAALACPVSMALMMWMMTRAQLAGPQQAARELPAGSQMASTTPMRPQEGAILADLTDPSQGRGLSSTTGLDLPPGLRV
jgi:hypothetical protein